MQASSTTRPPSGTLVDDVAFFVCLSSLVVAFSMIPAAVLVQA